MKKKYDCPNLAGILRAYFFRFPDADLSSGDI